MMGRQQFANALMLFGLIAIVVALGIVFGWAFGLFALGVACVVIGILGGT